MCFLSSFPFSTRHTPIRSLQHQVICNEVHGSLAHSVVTLLMSVHIHPRPIFLSRAGSADRVDVTTAIKDALEKAGGASSTDPEAGARRLSSVASAAFLSRSAPVLFIKHANPSPISNPNVNLICTPRSASDQAPLNERGRAYAERLGR